MQAQFVSNDPDYLSCKKQECKKYENGKCVAVTCAGSLTFHAINIRTDIEFVFFAGGFQTPCILTRSNPVSFASPEKPLYGHISSIDSTGTSVSSHFHTMIKYWMCSFVFHLSKRYWLLQMRLTWVSGDKEPQQVQYEGKSEGSEVVTFTQDDMCGKSPSSYSLYKWFIIFFAGFCPN